MLAMAYASVSAMRSARYPFAGLGCGCQAAAPPAVAGLGQDVTTSVLSFGAGFGIAAAGLVGFGLGWWGRGLARHMSSNRRRARR